MRVVLAWTPHAIGGRSGWRARGFEPGVGLGCLLKLTVGRRRNGWHWWTQAHSLLLEGLSGVSLCL